MKVKRAKTINYKNRLGILGFNGPKLITSPTQKDRRKDWYTVQVGTETESVKKWMDVQYVRGIYPSLVCCFVLSSPFLLLGDIIYLEEYCHECHTLNSIIRVGKAIIQMQFVKPQACFYESRQSAYTLHPLADVCILVQSFLGVFF